MMEKDQASTMLGMRGKDTSTERRGIQKTQGFPRSWLFRYVNLDSTHGVERKEKRDIETFR